MTKQQLAQAKAELDSGSLPWQIVQDLSLQEDAGQLRKALMDEYGQEEIVAKIRDNRPEPGKQDFSRLPIMVKNRIGKQEGLTVQDCDKMIENLNATITEVIRIKSNIDMTP